MIVDSLTDPGDSIERKNEKLLKITSALMRRVERATDDSDAAYAHFLRALMLEKEVRERTHDLNYTLELLNLSNARLSEANATAQRARADLANALEAVQQGFALFDADDTLVMCNSRFCVQMPDIRPRLEPGMAFADYVRAVSESRFLSHRNNETAQHWAARRQRLHAEQHVNFTVSMAGDQWLQVSEHRTEGGGTAIIQTDITDMILLERQEREKLLDDQARLIRATLDHINQGICIFDDLHRLAGWNNRLADLLSLPVSHLKIGIRFERLFRNLGRGFVYPEGHSASDILDWVASPSPRPSLVMTLMQGSARHFDLFGQEMPDGGFLISFTDKTAEQRAIRSMHKSNEMLEQRVLERTLALEDALGDAERANASKSRFVAAASHDLLQPLSAAKLYLSTLSGLGLPSEPGEVVQRVCRALNSVEDILNALLDISKLDSGVATADVSIVPVDRIFGTLREEFQGMALQKGLDFRVVDCGLHIASDPSYLRRILQNLIANAIRYTPQGKVLLGARRRGATLRIEVWDTGPGIPEDQQENIYKEFHRLSGAEQAGDGVGLGLAIVERAAALLGHPLALRSAPGRGTGFFVTVPLSRRGNEYAIPKRADPVQERQVVMLTALVIESDAEVRRALSSLLENWGVRVIDASSETEALETLAALDLAPEVLLVDYHLGGGENGLDAIATVREVYGPLPAALVTANRSNEIQRDCRRFGVVHIPKPLDPDSLMDFFNQVD